MSLFTRKRLFRALIVLVALWLLYLLFIGVSRWWAGRAPVQQVEASAELIAKGRYLADAADCAACHTAPDGAPFAGGVPLASPFGTLYGTNITSDPDHGIGRYTAEEFFEAMTEGKSRVGYRLYPAMPYVSYRAITREDSDAIYAYLMTRPAVKQANTDHDLRFPANFRLGLYGWDLLFGGDPIAPVSEGASPEWQRGRYLVDVLGHCGECHTPRGFLGHMDQDRPLVGNPELGLFAAPDITPQGLAARGWDRKALARYLATGVAGHAVASDEMLLVVNLSTSRLDETDVDAMTTYLLGDTPPDAVPMASGMPVAASGDVRQTYMNLCSGCHGRNARGVPNVAVALHGNSSVRDPDPHNLLVAILDGLPEHDFPGAARMQDMPGFGDELDDEQVADLATWLRQRHGGQEVPVDAASVRALRGRAGH
ncbi:c-type cytochrome [Luteimonas salinilitoris]|uniref:Cytochrome c n=1 Tax=Luteimonas salinilitoris TaxID=3237697 RepID=A0ABV4HTD4_9GAMM